MKQWRPWEHATGPRTADGKSRSARNADKGGEWRKLREMVKTLNQAMREHREVLRRAKACSSPYWTISAEHLTNGTDRPAGAADFLLDDDSATANRATPINEA